MAPNKIWKIQPFKGVYTGCAMLGVFLVRIPYWTLRNLLPSWRPRSSWTIGRCIQINMTRYMMFGLGPVVGGLGHNPTYKALELGKGVNGFWIDGTPELVTDELKKWADIAGVESIRIPGYWQHKPGTEVNMGEPAKLGEKVLLAFHGGGYMAFSAHPSSVASVIPREIMARTPSVLRSLSVEYRLTSPGANPFPAQLLDALAGYSYLVRSLGFKPEDIIIVGDSAGGNLAIALARYLVSYSSSIDPQLGQPGGLVLLSPWVDLSPSHVTPGSSIYTNANSDFLLPPPSPQPEFGQMTFVGPHGVDFLTHPYISPAARSNSSVSFKGFPRSIIVLGDAELLVDSIRTLEERMVNDMSRENVTTYEAKDAFHDFMVFEFCEPQRSEATVAVAKWIETL